MNSRPNLKLALVGNPNCGKTALFNLLTGSHHKVANYSGVTVECKTGKIELPTHKNIELIDLPGIYSLTPHTLDEKVCLNLIQGLENTPSPNALLLVLDATNLPLGLRLTLSLLDAIRQNSSAHLPVVIVLNMMDIAEEKKLKINLAALEKTLGYPVIPTIATQKDAKKNGRTALLNKLAEILETQNIAQDTKPEPGKIRLNISTASSESEHLAKMQTLNRRINQILTDCVPQASTFKRFNHYTDKLLMHPVFGWIILMLVLLLLFQAVFAWTELPTALIENGVGHISQYLTSHMPDALLRSLLVDGVLAGAGTVIIFLPQILLLFFFILLLESCGYLPRACFLLDSFMTRIGLSGRAFIPLLSSFACAVPGIMATRTITNRRERLLTMLLAPLMTCSARLPVYALLIAAFIPQGYWGPLNWQGLTLFGLYFLGIVTAIAIAWLTQRLAPQKDASWLMIELPPYRWPDWRNLLISLWDKIRTFLKRIGTIIVALTIVLWFLCIYPAPPEGAEEPAILYSWAGQIGQALHYIFAPLGFSWEISVALIPGLLAREVAVSALATVYAVSAIGGTTSTEQSLTNLVSQNWSHATGYALLIWYVFAPQCLSTFAIIKQETNSWRYPILMLVYLFGLAYVSAWITYRLASAWGG